ncbi:GNAT family acetyltransferase [Aliamphritea ceti]|uniref:GNAT family acetyltransferase n=1 Tax=Aliamphritea ceti TaxID=1524258 RepID=UPI0021C3EFA4|nr:GNAT family acetyltransferase [Aliamphritea ceti]
MQIRPFHINDQTDVIQLWSDCGLVKPQNNPAKDICRKLNIQPELFLVGYNSSGKIIASIMGGYEGHRGWINYLAVHPSQQRCGYARLLMLEIEHRLQALGCPKINLQIRDTNTEVLAFYRAIGYLEDPVISFGKRLETD